MHAWASFAARAVATCTKKPRTLVNPRSLSRLARQTCTLRTDNASSAGTTTPRLPHKYLDRARCQRWREVHLAPHMRQPASAQARRLRVRAPMMHAVRRAMPAERAPAPCAPPPEQCARARRLPPASHAVRMRARACCAHTSCAAFRTRHPHLARVHDGIAHARACAVRRARARVHACDSAHRLRCCLQMLTQ